MRDFEAIDTVVIGGGQAGLSVGYHLARRGVPFVILEANQRVGDSWRQRWDSLRLFSPAKLDGLNGFPFPAEPYSFPTKDEMADYLEAYATRFSLPVRTGVRVDRVSRSEGGLLVSMGNRRIQARNVVVAMADFQRPRLPGYASSLDRDITQMHSSAYQRPAQLKPGGVLLVGLGNSGAEIARELVRAGHETYVSGEPGGELPFRVDGLAGRLVLVRLMFRVVFFRLLKLDNPLGRVAHSKIAGQRDAAHPGQVQGPRGRWRDPGATHRGRAPGEAAARGRPDARRDERHLVHRVRAGILVDRPAGVRRAGRAGTMARHHQGRAGAQLRGAAFPLRDVVGDDPRRGTGCGVRGGADRGAGEPGGPSPRRERAVAVA